MYIYIYIYICIYIYIYIANYADNNTPCVTDVTADDIDGVIVSLENSSKTLFKWFSDSLFKGNVDKCLLLVNVKDEVTTKLVKSECEQLLGDKLDYKLTFNSHDLYVTYIIHDLHIKGNGKINAKKNID